MIPPEAGRHVTWLDQGLGLVKGSDGGANGLLIVDEDVILVDAGMAPEAADDLAPHVSLLLLTSADVAHAREAHRFDRVWAPHAEAAALENEEAFLETFGVGPRDGAITPAWLRKQGYHPAVVEKRYRAGGILELPGSTWHLIGTPGPSPGATSLLAPDRRILFAGRLGPGDVTPWYGWPNADVEDVDASLERLATLDVGVLLSSHAAPVRRGAKKTLQDLRRAIRQRDARLYDALTPSRSIHDLVALGVVQGRDAVVKDEAAAYFERVMVEKHLNRLLERGLAFARQDGRYQQA